MEIIFSVDAMVNALIGGAMMGLAASILLLFNGRIMGVCGIAHGIFYFQKENVIWRLLFILGMFAGGYLLTELSIDAFQRDLNLVSEETVATAVPAAVEAATTTTEVTDAIPAAAAEEAPVAEEHNITLMQFLISAFLIGFGTSLGTGCTTGHGVCGLSRLSFRGMAATMLFMFSGGMTVFITRHVL